jgi:hypothetical protein
MLTGSIGAADNRGTGLRIASKSPARRTARHASEDRSAHLKIAALAQFPRYIRRYILRPFLGGEGNDPDRAFVLTFEHVKDDGLQIGGFDVGFAIDATIAAKIVEYEVHVLIFVVRDNRWGPACSRHP